MGLAASWGAAGGASVSWGMILGAGAGTGTTSSQWGHAMFKPMNLASDVMLRPHDGHAKVNEGSPVAMATFLAGERL